MKQNKYLPKQMNGDVINAYANSLSDEFSNADTIINHLYNLSIDTADEIEINSIGCIIGYPRPLIPEGFSAENLFLLGGLPLETDSLHGLGTEDSEVGGVLSTTEKSTANYMEIGLYKKVLKYVAYIKRSGITIKCIDKIARIISKNYTIEFLDNGDISINFSEPIGYVNVWCLTQLFYKFATTPQVIITSGD